MCISLDSVQFGETLEKPWDLHWKTLSWGWSLGCEVWNNVGFLKKKKGNKHNQNKNIKSNIHTPWILINESFYLEIRIYNAVNASNISYTNLPLGMKTSWRGIFYVILIWAKNTFCYNPLNLKCITIISVARLILCTFSKFCFYFWFHFIIWKSKFNSVKKNVLLFKSWNSHGNMWISFPFSFNAFVVFFSFLLG